MVFADNFWIIGRTPQEAKSTLECWLHLLERKGYGVRDEELSWTSPDFSDEDPEARRVMTTKRGRQIAYYRADQPTKVVGAMMTMDNNDECALKHRASCAWRVFEYGRRFSLAKPHR